MKMHTSNTVKTITRLPTQLLYCLPPAWSVGREGGCSPVGIDQDQGRPWLFQTQFSIGWQAKRRTEFVQSVDDNDERFLGRRPLIAVYSK